MVMIMEMDNGKVVRDPESYDDEVLNAGWLPRPEASLQLAQIEHEPHKEPQAPPIADIEAFLEAMYRNQA